MHQEWPCEFYCCTVLYHMQLKNNITYFVRFEVLQSSGMSRHVVNRYWGFKGSECIHIHHHTAQFTNHNIWTDLNAHTFSQNWNTVWQIESNTKKYEKMRCSQQWLWSLLTLVPDNQKQPLLFSYMFHTNTTSQNRFYSALFTITCFGISSGHTTGWLHLTYHSCSHARGTLMFTLTWVEVFTFLIMTVVFWDTMTCWLVLTNISDKLAASIFQVSPRRVSCMESMVALYTKRVGWEIG